jgi:sugar lactone lactonase YvrE
LISSGIAKASAAHSVIFFLSMLRGPLPLLVIVLALASSALAQPYSFTHFAGATGGPSFEDGDGAAARFKFPGGIAVDASGSIYVADSGNHTVRKITPGGAVSTLAGVADQWGSADGRASHAHFNDPNGVAVDGEGNVYVADTVNQSVRKITPTGVVTTFGGFNSPEGVAADAAGNVYVADTSSHTIRKISRLGVITTLAGLAGSPGSSDGTGSAARFNDPWGVAVDGGGNVFVADFGNDIIRKITPGGVVTTVAGLAGSPGTSDGTGSAARFKSPAGVAVDSAGVIYVADSANDMIRKITAGGVVSTIAGAPPPDDGSDIFVSVDGIGTEARFQVPFGIAVDGKGNVYVSDTFGHSIRKINSAGVVTTLAGMADQFAYRDGARAEARFHQPYDVALDDGGNLYVADTWNHAIRKITSAGVVSTVAGVPGVPGNSDGPAGAAQFYFPTGIAVDHGNLYVADGGNRSIRKISGGMVTTLAGSAAQFDTPFGLTVDSAGNVYVADGGNHTVRKISADGMASTLAGQAGSPGSSDGTGAAARFNRPSDVAFDPFGNLYVADAGNDTIRRITSSGVVSTLAGLAGSPGSTDGNGSAARFDHPSGLAIGRLAIYVVDSGNNTIRAISGGRVSTLAGSTKSSGCSDGSFSGARFNNPQGAAADADDNLYVADVSNHAIRMGSPLTDRAEGFPPNAPVGTVRQLQAYPQTATAWQWEMIVRPPGSTAQLSSTTFPNPTFVPDVAGHYAFRLRATSASGVSVTTVSLDATGDLRHRPARH